MFFFFVLFCFQQTFSNPDMDLSMQEDMIRTIKAIMKKVHCPHTYIGQKKIKKELKISIKKVIDDGEEVLQHQPGQDFFLFLFFLKPSTRFS